MMEILEMINWTTKELEEFRKLAHDRNQGNIKQGRTDRHKGLSSEEAHYVGILSEEGAARFLLFAAIPFNQSLKNVRDHSRVTEDFIIYGNHVGAKAAGRDFKIWKDRSRVYYPNKDHPEEKKSHIGYPDFVIFVEVDRKKGISWIRGWCNKNEIKSHPSFEISGGHCHGIPTWRLSRMWRFHDAIKGVAK